MAAKRPRQAAKNTQAAARNSQQPEKAHRSYPWLLPLVIVVAVVVVVGAIVYTIATGQSFF